MIRMLIILLRKNVDVEEVTIDPEAKWTYNEKEDVRGMCINIHN